MELGPGAEVEAVLAAVEARFSSGGGGKSGDDGGRFSGVCCDGDGGDGDGGGDGA